MTYTSAAQVVPFPGSFPDPFCVREESDAYCVDLSADKLHVQACEAHRVGNRGKLTLCSVLRVLHETQRFLELGYSTVAGYADAHFDMRRSETFNCIRVAEVLEQCALLRDAFAEGQIGWWALKQITRVATLETQEKWLAFVRKHSTREIEAEVRDAQRSGRDQPRESSYGLPNLDQKFVARLSRTEMEKLRKALGAIAAEIGSATGKDEVTTEQALMLMAEQVLRSRGGGSDAREQSTRVDYALVYQACPDCSKTRAHTAEGFVEVDSSEVERVAGAAEIAVVDALADGTRQIAPPTPPKMRRQILLRDGGKCGNPNCTHSAEHCHHIVFRADGGETSLYNEVAVCSRCHALIHAGLLTVTGNSRDGLSWKPRVSRDLTLASDSARTDRLPVFRLESHASPGQQSTRVDSTVASRFDVEALAGGLVRLGASRKRAREAVLSAIADDAVTPKTESTILRAALRSLHAPV